MRAVRGRTSANGRSLRRRVLRVGAAPVGGRLLRPLVVLALLLLAAGAVGLLLLATMLLGAIRFEAAQAACRPGGLPGDASAAAVVVGRPSGRRSPGGALPASRIVQYAADAGFSGDDLTIAVAVALAESGGVPDIENHANTNGSSDYGLWQINTVHRGAGFDPSRAADPSYNALWARRVFLAAGGSWRPWVAYTNGSYQRHLATARRAVGTAPVARARLASAAVGGGAAQARELAAVCPTVPGGTTIRLARVTGRSGPLTSADLASLGAAIGHAVPPYSVLRDATAYGDGTGGPSVNLLAPQMQASVARLELAMGARLMVVSGYRTPAYQAELCTRVAGPCAPPGRSMHQHGLAVDVRNWRQALPHLAAVGLCQPMPTNDAVHLSHVDGREC